MNDTTVIKEPHNPEGSYYTIEYEFTNDDGEILGTSEKSGPYTFCSEHDDALPGLKKHVVGQPIGSILQFITPAQEAYGEYKEDLVRVIPLSVIPESAHLRLGQQLTINNQRGIVTALDSHNVTIDSNHPLAGMNLHFHVTITGIHDEMPEHHDCGCGHTCQCH